MKTIHLKLVFMICISLFKSYSGYAQFTPPFPLPEYSYSAASTQPRNTGCDIYHYNSDDYRVSVWEPTGTTVAFGWDVDYGGNNYTGTSSLTYTSGVGDPDVCLVEKSGDIFAIVAYYHLPTTRWYWETFEFDVTTTSFITFTSAAALDAGSFGTSINIDGNERAAGEFAIVWDDASGRIFTSVGDMSSFILGSRINIASGAYPDVSMIYDGNNDVVHFAYIDVNGDLLVDDHQFGTLATGSAGSSSNVFNSSPSGSNQFYYPRIASPNGSTGSPSEWTTVVEETDNSMVYLITGFNNASSTPIYYNDGNAPQNSPFNISGEPNYHVSVAYDSNYPTDGVWVGWNMNNQLGNLNNNGAIVNDADYSIVLKCNSNAVPIFGGTYWQVPNGIVAGNLDLSGFMSMAGRYGNDEIFLSYVNVILNGSSVDDVVYKKVPGVNTASSFKTMASSSNSPSFQEANSLIEILKSAGIYEKFELKIYSIEGRILLNATLNTMEELRFDRSVFNLSTSIYLCEFRSLESGKMLHLKLFIEN